MKSMTVWTRIVLVINLVAAVGVCLYVPMYAPAEEQLSLEQVIAQYGDAGREAARVGFTQGAQDVLEEG